MESRPRKLAKKTLPPRALKPPVKRQSVAGPARGGPNKKPAGQNPAAKTYRSGAKPVSRSRPGANRPVAKPNIKLTGVGKDISTLIIRPRAGETGRGSTKWASSLGGDGRGKVEGSRTRDALKSAGSGARIYKSMQSNPTLSNLTPYTTGDALRQAAKNPTAGRKARIPKKK